MTHSSEKSHTDPPSQQQHSSDQHDIGYGKPPKHSQFPKGKSGNPGGRPKAPIGISIKEILDGDQRGKNGEVISRRMHDSGLMRREKSINPMVVHVPSRTMTHEEYEECVKHNFGLPMAKPTK
jgi:hypothetical protein